MADVEPAAASREAWLKGEHEDPVFEGMLKEFRIFDEALKAIDIKLDDFMLGFSELAAGIRSLSEGLAAELARLHDPGFVSEGCKLREAANQIARSDAPCSSLGKLQRNLEFNISKPIKDHLANNEKLMTEVNKRRLLLDDLKGCLKQMELCENLDPGDKRSAMAKEELAVVRASFKKVDSHVFEWLYALDEHRGDILDSCLQTLKYLQYEFFASSAHALSAVLPARMEFRPMPEMEPKCLEAQVHLELQSEDFPLEFDSCDSGAAFASRLLQRLTRDNKSRAGAVVEEAPAAFVDPLSLSSLLAQGFEESRARRALRLYGNDTQAAMDWLLDGAVNQSRDEVRRPVTAGRGVPEPRSSLEAGFGPRPSPFGRTSERAN